MEKDTLHTGYKKLIQLTVGELSVCIMGKDKDVKYADGSGADIKVFFPKKNEVLPAERDIILAENDMYKPDSATGNFAIKYRPLFFEQTEYAIYAEVNGDKNEKIEMWHINRHIREKVIYPSKRKNVLSGSFNFGSDIGYSDFVFKIDGQEYFTLTIEVFPSKISYKKDYEDIRNDIINEIYALIFDALKKTYSGFKLTSERTPTRLEFYAIFQVVFSDFYRAIDRIIIQPHHQLRTEHEILPIQKAKRIDNQSLKWLEKHPEHVKRLSDDRLAISKVNAVKKSVTYDTKENRFAKHIIEKTIWRVMDFKRSYLEYTKERNDTTNRKADLEFVQGIEKQINTLRSRLENSFFWKVEYNNECVEMSLVFSMAPGYRELFRCYLKMEQALELFNDVFQMSQKDLSTMYEYWCFIKLNAIVRDRLERDTNKKPKVDKEQIITKLRKGSKSKITYTIHETGEKVVLSYNPERSQPTVLQKPNNVLSIEKAGENGSKYEFVFDAKYKIDTDSPYAKTYGSGPKEEDINTMHRYRDAIVSEIPDEVDKYKRDMYGAYVLFPYEDTERKYQYHPFYQSIRKVNIGGFPFLPSQTEMVEEQIEDLLAGVGKVQELEKDLLLIEKRHSTKEIMEGYMQFGNHVLNRPV